MSIRQPSAFPRARGFTLIEVLTAIVVLSVGLLGLGLLLGTSVRSNHNGMLHTQATFAAETILDRMRANIPGVWGNAYNGTWDAATAAPGVACLAASPCNPAQVAARDVFAWGQLVSQLLPAGSGTVLCTRNPAIPAPSAATLQTVPVYNGTCTITVNWNETTEGTEGVVAQNYVWRVQP